MDSKTNNSILVPCFSFPTQCNSNTNGCKWCFQFLALCLDYWQKWERDNNLLHSFSNSQHCRLSGDHGKLLTDLIKKRFFQRNWRRHTEIFYWMNTYIASIKWENNCVPLSISLYMHAHTVILHTVKVPLLKPKASLAELYSLNEIRTQISDF